MNDYKARAEANSLLKNDLWYVQKILIVDVMMVDLSRYLSKNNID